MKIIQITERLGTQRHIAAVRQGVLLNVPVIVIGAFAVMLNQVSIPWYQQVTQLFFGSAWEVFWQAVATAAREGISILLVLSISYFLALSHKKTSGKVHPLTAAFVAFVCLLVWIQPFTKAGIQGLPFEATGVGGIFFAVFTALLATEFFLWLTTVNRLGSRRLFADVADPILSQALACILPAAATILLFALLKDTMVLAHRHGIDMNLYRSFVDLFQQIQSPVVQLTLFYLVVHLLWFLGLHGNNIMEPVLESLQLDQMQSVFVLEASQSAGALTKTFLDVFGLIGGSGSTFSLLLALFVISRRGNMAWLARLSTIPAIFNINELLLFGLPVVLNPVLLIPFLVVPIVLTCMAYLAISHGMVAAVIQPVHWTTPPLISGYLATGSWTGAGLQLIGIAIGTLIYLPFVSLHEAQKNREMTSGLRQLTDEVAAAPALFRNHFLSRQDEAGTLARLLAHDLKHTLARNELFLEYQPQVDQHNRVVGIEALLRWSHPTYGRIPPILMIAVAEEAGLINAIGKWVLDTACRQLRDCKYSGLDGIRMAVNVSAIQLQSRTFIEELLAILHQNELENGELEIEITENIALNNDARTICNLDAMRRHGIRVAIDDFGMGHTSLRYIKHFPVDRLKIDGILSRDVIHDENCQKIIASIVALCSTLGIETVVEYVETEEQRNLLLELGCRQYQGYLYSPPLPAAEMVRYLLEQNKPQRKVVNRKQEHFGH